MISGRAITELSDDELRRLDAEAVRLTRGPRQRERLRLGDALAALDDRFKELGFRNFSAYVKERVGLKPRFCSESRTLSRRSRELPKLRKEVLSSRLGWSMAELLARHATADDEEELIEACRGETIRAVRRILKERGEEPEPEPDVEERLSGLDLTMPIEHAVRLEITRRQSEHVNGGCGEPGSWLECLLMEGHATLLELAPEAFEGAEDVAARLRGWVEARRRAEERNVEAEERARPEPVPDVAIEDDEEEEEELPTDPVALDRVIVQRATRIASGDVWLGPIFEKLFAARAWARLGYATETQYALDRFGMSRSAVRQRITQTRRARWLEGLDEAVQEGRIAASHAMAIARVATPDTLEAWIERATARTYKHLLEEVQLVELIARVDPSDDPLFPPSDELIDEWHRIEADWLSGAFIRRWVKNVKEQRVSPEAALTESADDEPYVQRGAHVEEVEAALSVMLARLGGDGGEPAGPVGTCGEHGEDAAGVGGEPGAECAGVGGQRGGQWARDDDRRDGDDRAGDGGEHGDERAGDGGEHGDDAAERGGEHDADPARHGRQPGAELPSRRGAVQTSVGSSARAEAGASARAVQTSVGRSGGPAARAVQTSVGSSEDVGGGSVTAEPVRRTAGVAARVHGLRPPSPGPSREREGRKVSARVVAREDVCLFYRELEAVFERSGLPGTFVELLMVGFWDAWGHLFDVGNTWKPIHDRDRHQCTCPVCFVRKSLANHHIEYRSHGGGHEMSNQLLACDFCHLDGEHGGRLKVRGTAEKPVWLIGRTPILRIEGREKIEIAGARDAA